MHQSMRNILSCFVIFFFGFTTITGATQRNVNIASNHDLIRFCGGSEAENGFLPVAAKAAQRRQFTHLVAMRDQIQQRTDAFFFKVAVQSADVNALPRIHKLQHPHDVREELAFVHKQHISGGHFVSVLRFQLFNGGAHDARDHGAVVGRKQRIFGRRVARVACKIDNHHAHVAICALLVQIG